MSWYERVVFNRVLELTLDRPFMHEERRAALAPASGSILDIGSGTGLNFPHYPEAVQAVTTLTLEPDLDHRARARAAARGLSVEHVRADAAEMPFDAGRFDTVVCTLVLCSIGDPAAALREIRRVLRPVSAGEGGARGGRLLFLEHVIAEPGARRTMQRLVDPVTRMVNCGCTTLRDTRAAIEAAGFRFETIREGDLEPMPWPVRRRIRGVAVPS